MTTDMPAIANKPRTESATRRREADAMRQLLADAKQALSQLYTTWGLWADSVRQDAEARQGVPAGADLAADREYWASPGRWLSDRASQNGTIGRRSPVPRG